MNTKLIAFLTSFVVLSMILAAFSLGRPAVSPSVADTSGISNSQEGGDEEGVVLAPAGRPILSVGDGFGVADDGSLIQIGFGPITIEEAKGLLKNIPLRDPDKSRLPAEFVVVATWYQNSTSTYEFEGQEYSPERVTMLLWDKELGPNTQSKDFHEDGGISIRIGYGLGSNETGSCLYKNMDGDFSYLWGYPTTTGDGYLQHFNFETGITYSITGNYLTPVLIKVLESLIVEETKPPAIAG